MEDKSAHWLSASLQVNPFTYKGRNAPSASFSDEKSYNAALLARCKQLDISMIAVTDHWCVDSALQLIEDAGKFGVTALPGFEAVSSEGVHLLVIFEAGTPSATINSAIGRCGGVAGAGNGTLGGPYAQIMTSMCAPDLDALVVPAHANVASGGMLTIRGGNPLEKQIKHPDLHAIGITPSQSEATNQKQIFARNKPFERDYPLAKIHADDICHPDTLEKDGAVTWFKVSEATLASIKLAIRLPDTRVSLVNPTANQRPIIRSIAWNGGFLDEVGIHLSDDLTAFIGGRGTGKSTAIESLRFALDVTPLGSEALSDHKKIVSDVLGPATCVEIVVDATAPRVGRFTIRRTVGRAAEVFDSSETITSLKPSDVIGNVEIFGQHELAELAQDKGLIASMLQRFAGQNLENSTKSRTQQDLVDNREELGRVERDIETLDSKLADLPRLHDQLKHFEEDGLPAKMEEQRLLAEEAAVFKVGAQRIDDILTILENNLPDRVVDELKSSVSVEGESPRKQYLDKVNSITQSLAEVVSTTIRGLRNEVQSAATGVSEAKNDWTAATDPLRSAHGAALKKLRDEGYDPEKYLTTIGSISELEATKPERDTLIEKKRTLLDRRTGLLGQLEQHEREQENTLKSAVRSANKATGSRVNVRVATSDKRDHIHTLMDKHISGARTQIRAAIDSSEFSPKDFAACARAGLSDLESKYSVRGAQASSIIAAGESFYRELEEQHIGYAVDVFLNIAPVGKGTELRRLDRLSKGQRATALLLLLLSVSDSPLVIDQPEDDLDNRFVYDGVVTKLRDLKGIRQIIVSTHNANVPVLGDAELIVTLEGDGTHGWPVKDGVGSLDNKTVRKLAEDLLEGGSTAFGARKHLYGV